MLNDQKITYGYNDIGIIPSVISDIKHRSECNPFDKMGKLPIFTAPMSSVVDENNFSLFESNGIHTILPRNIDFEVRKEFIKNGKWVALSLQEFDELILNNHDLINSTSTVKHILIDVANGHMKILYDFCNKAKEIYGDNIKIMIGNIANPMAYEIALQHKVDYIRLNIGSGSACITSSNTAIHYGAASLIDCVRSIKESAIERGLTTEETCTKIVADGGIKNYSDVIKALALGADYVMIGGIFASCIESAAPIYKKNEFGNNIQVPKENVRMVNGEIKISHGVYYEKPNFKLYKMFYGMASRKGQIDLYGQKKKTSEGLERLVYISTDIRTWANNMADYLRSAMSYLNIRELPTCGISSDNICLLSPNEQMSINK